MESSFLTRGQALSLWSGSTDPKTLDYQRTNSEVKWSEVKWSEVKWCDVKWSDVKWCEVTQSCPTLCDPVDGSPPGSSVHGILQARILEWVAISFSRGSSRPRDRTQVSHTAGRRFNLWATRENMGKANIKGMLYKGNKLITSLTLLFCKTQCQRDSKQATE